MEKPAGDSSMLIQIFITLSLLLNAIPRMFFHAFMGVKKKTKTQQFFNSDSTECHDACAHMAKADDQNSFMLKVIFKCWSFLSYISVGKSACQ